MTQEYIEIHGARENNMKIVTLRKHAKVFVQQPLRFGGYGVEYNRRFA